MMHRFRALVAAGFVAFALAGASQPITALAGSNGQQIDLYDSLGTVYSACADGTNQYGQHITGVCWATPGTYNPLYNYWWVGWVIVDEYNSSGGYIGSVATYVPKSQSSNWWCFNDANGSGWAC